MTRFRPFLLAITTTVWCTQAGANEPSTKVRVGPAGAIRAMYNIGSAPRTGNPVSAARSFLVEHATQFQLTDLEASLSTAAVQTVAGGSHVRFTQQYQGIPVYRADIVVSMDENNRVGMLVNNYRNDISLHSLQPKLTQAIALQHAREALGANDHALGADDTAELMVYRTDAGHYRLSYRCLLTREYPAGAWELFVDARTGDIVHREDRYANYNEGDRVQGRGYVYLNDPLSAARQWYNHPGFSDNDDSDSDSLNYYRTLAPLDSITVENGVFKLKGPYCNVTDIESPSDPPFYFSIDKDNFLYTRSQPEFEAVMVYYHVSTAYRHLQELGFSNSTLTQLRLDPHGLQGVDNSHYNPNANYIAWGEGGVDDAEDADAIWHEYGHAIQFNLVPSWGGGESGALGEGFSDYWAGSYARSLNQWRESDMQYNWLYNWNGHNPFWLGRILNDGLTYPFGSLEIHLAGQIWSSALMGIWNELGRDVTDRLVIKSLYYLGSGAMAEDNAEAILQADRDLYGGAHLQTLVYWLGTVKHFIDPNAHAPAIAHTPLKDSQTSNGPFVVSATITSAAGIASTQVIWGRNGAMNNAVTLIRNGDLFSGAIPASSNTSRIGYYIVAIDSTGTVAREPRDPAAQYGFQAGIDSVLPTIKHDPVTFFLQNAWPPRIFALISDDLGVDSAWVEYVVSSQLTSRTFPLARTANGYEGILPIPASALQVGETVSYRIVASDASNEHNLSTNPKRDFFTFAIVDSSGLGTPTVSEDRTNEIPSTFALHQNYPNPFNPSTTIVYLLPESGIVKAAIYDILGQEIRTLMDGFVNAGTHSMTWNAETNDGHRVNSGVFFCRLEMRGASGRHNAVIKMLHTK